MSHQTSLSRFFQRPSAKRVVSVDIDGTIANISARRNHALSKYSEGTKMYWDTLLDGDLYHMDLPLLKARETLNAYVDELKGAVVYLSGRRAGTEKQTKVWLESHGFPEGQIIHREKGRQSKDFKARELKELKGLYKLVDAHFGDRLEDDRGAAEKAGIRFIHIKENEESCWLDLDGFGFRKPHH